VARPVVLVVEEEAVKLAELERDLAWRYGRDYEVTAVRSPFQGLAALERLREAGRDVALVFADDGARDMPAEQFLDRARALHPAARRVLIVRYAELSTNARLNRAMALGHVDDWLLTPWDPPDLTLHPTVTQLLAEWVRATARPRFEAICIVGERWAPRSHRLRDYLERNGLPFGFYDHDSARGRALLQELGLGHDALPLAVLFDGRTLVHPSETEIAAAFGVRTRPEPGRYDVAIVGAGPAGLSAALYASSEGLRTLHLEADALGGQAGTTSRIRNYLGFPRGIGGQRLALSASQQSAFFGAVFVYGGANRLERSGRDWALVLDDGTEAVARSVVIATGARYRRLGVPALEALVGRGVFYGAAVTEATAVTGQEVFVVGGGNSAGQAVIHLARHARLVTLLVRGSSLARTMSDYLIREIEELPNVVVRVDAQVVGGHGDAQLEALDVVVGRDAAAETVPAAALFVLIGARPRSDWLPQGLARDGQGFVLTGRDLVREGALPEGWPLDRPPLLAETSLPGVFAAGDVRYGSMKRVAAAVGEGSTAVRLVHDYLAER
jgi:thioredoxin reductase (NADPH)